MYIIVLCIYYYTYIIIYNIQTHTYIHTFYYLFIWRNLIPHIELIIVAFIIVILIRKYFHLNCFVQDSVQGILAKTQNLKIWW